MDWVMIRQKVIGACKKYRYAILVLVLGLILLMIPGRTSQKTETTEQPKIQQTDTHKGDITESLRNILCRIQGVGDVQILLTTAAGEKTIYQTDNDITGGENATSRLETVIITNGNREESGLVQQIIPESYMGAIVVCQGADSPAVRLAVVEAVTKVTGLGSDRVCVLKMK